MASVAVPETDTRRAIMTVLFVGVFMSALDSAIIGPIVPALRAAFAIDNTQVVLVSIIFTLCSLSSTTLMASSAIVTGAEMSICSMCLALPLAR